jgi:phage shock protein A
VRCTCEKAVREATKPLEARIAELEDHLSQANDALAQSRTAADVQRVREKAWPSIDGGVDA